MSLPFTHDQFLDVFAAYNRVLWPGAAFLWLLTAAALVLGYRRRAYRTQVLAGVLAIHWAWSGLAYHLAFFRSINPVASLFAALFVIQALLFLWRGVFRGTIAFEPRRPLWGPVGMTLVAYAMLYPLVGLLLGLEYPRLPTFGVPCPSTILTAGLLILAPKREATILGVIPLLWAAIGGSAAFLLGIRADLILPAAGAVLLARLLLPERVRIEGS